MTHESNPHFLKHPEVKELFGAVFRNLVSESDRGAVLVGLAQVDDQLAQLFAAVVPKALSKRRREGILEYPGPLGSVSAKADLALVVRLIPQRLHAAINQLRKLRNLVAHSAGGFTLEEHDEPLRKMFDLGDNVPAFINRIVLELMLRDVTDSLTGPDGPKSDAGENCFTSAMDVYEYIEANPALISPLEGKRRRYELAIGVVLICALIIRHRDEAKSLLGQHETLSSVARSLKQPAQPESDPPL